MASSVNWTFQKQQEERRLTADDVLALPLGSRVYIKDENNETLCTVAGHPDRKFLTYRKDGLIKKCAIKDYTGKYYTMEGNDVH